MNLLALLPKLNPIETEILRSALTKDWTSKHPGSVTRIRDENLVGFTHIDEAVRLLEIRMKWGSLIERGEKSLMTKLLRYKEGCYESSQSMAQTE